MTIYDRYTDEAIAKRLEMIAENVKAFPPVERAAWLSEAARRLVSSSSSDERLEKFKQRVRDRAIAEAERRNWCGEFDVIIKELGMAGRFATYAVVWSVRGEPNPQTSRVLARDDEHAWRLVQNQVNRVYGQYGTLMSVTKER